MGFGFEVSPMLGSKGLFDQGEEEEHQYGYAQFWHGFHFGCQRVPDYYELFVHETMRDMYFYLFIILLHIRMKQNINCNNMGFDAGV